jgi:enoyl reductase
MNAKTLADLAYGRLRVPDTTASVSPQVRQTVNLPAWVWLDGAVFRLYSVTASLPAVGLSATTTARPVGLRIVPGTPHADLYPAGGSCALSGGRIGAPYTKGVKGDPPCGVVYRRASTTGPYRFAVSVTWEVSWTGSDGTGGDLGEATFEGPAQNMTVQEIQAIVTRHE